MYLRQFILRDKSLSDAALTGHQHADIAAIIRQAHTFTNPVLQMKILCSQDITVPR